MQTLLTALSTPKMKKNPKKTKPTQTNTNPPHNNSEKDVKAIKLWMEDSGKESVMPGVFIVRQTKE